MVNVWELILHSVPDDVQVGIGIAALGTATPQ